MIGVWLPNGLDYLAVEFAAAAPLDQGDAVTAGVLTRRQ